MNPDLAHELNKVIDESVPPEPSKTKVKRTRVVTPGKSDVKRGFAVMDPKLVSEIARKGGLAAHVAGTAHEFTREEARAAGRKGGKASHAARRAKTP